MRLSFPNKIALAKHHRMLWNGFLTAASKQQNKTL